jgi:hypothetical protein
MSDSEKSGSIAISSSDDSSGGGTIYSSDEEITATVPKAKITMTPLKKGTPPSSTKKAKSGATQTASKPPAVIARPSFPSSSNSSSSSSSSAAPAPAPAQPTFDITRGGPVSTDKDARRLM